MNAVIVRRQSEIRRLLKSYGRAAGWTSSEPAGVTEVKRHEKENAFIVGFLLLTMAACQRASAPGAAEGSFAIPFQPL